MSSRKSSAGSQNLINQICALENPSLTASGGALYTDGGAISTMPVGGSGSSPTTSSGLPAETSVTPSTLQTSAPMTSNISPQSTGSKTSSATHLQLLRKAVYLASIVFFLETVKCNVILDIFIIEKII